MVIAAGVKAGGECASGVQEKQAIAAVAAASDAVGVAIGGGGGREGRTEEGELDLFDVLLELPVVDEGVLPLGDHLRLQLP